jgi:hypothetical protein
MCERDRSETGCKLRSVFLLCAAALPWYTPHTGRTGTATARLSDGYRHNAPSSERQTASASTDGTGFGSTIQNTHSARTQPHRQPQHMLPAQCTIERETDRLSLYHGTHPTAGAHSPTDSLSDGYRHRVPHPPSDSLQRAAQIHTGTRCGSTMCERLPSGTGTAHRAAQMACVFLRGSLYRLLRV